MRDEIEAAMAEWGALVKEVRAREVEQEKYEKLALEAGHALSRALESERAAKKALWEKLRSIAEKAVG